MQINYDFPWYLQNSEGFMALYTGLFNTAQTISPITFLNCLNVDHAEYPQQIKTVAMLYGLRGDWVGIEDALIYDINNWSGGLSNGITFTPAKISISTSDFEAFVTAHLQPDQTGPVTQGLMYFVTDGVESAWNFMGRNSVGALICVYSDYQSAFEAAGFTFTGPFENEEQVTFVAAPSTDYEQNYWSGRLVDTLDLLTNYIKAKIQIRNKNLTLQSLKQFFAVCLAHRNFNPNTAISVTESTLHFDLTVAVDVDILNDMVTLLSVDPWPFGKPTGISYSINYVQE